MVEHAKFSVHERPTATVACLVRFEDGLVAETRVAIGSVGARPVRAAAAEELLTGVPADELGSDVLAEAGEKAAEAAAPVDDAGGSADYKAQLVRVLVERAIRKALAA